MKWENIDLKLKSHDNRHVVGKSLAEILGGKKFFAKNGDRFYFFQICYRISKFSPHGFFRNHNFHGLIVDKMVKIICILEFFGTCGKRGLWACFSINKIKEKSK